MRYDICSRQWDDAGRPVRHISLAQGQFAVSDDPDAVITTVLGSCVAACLRDPVRGIGGMNHFVLPDSPTPSADTAESARYGAVLMPQLLDALLAQGARSSRLEALVLGGASPSGSYYNVGQRNLAFARAFLAERGVKVLKTPEVSPAGCRIEFWPASGRLKQTPVGHADRRSDG
ncbi:MAG: hypothetical protein A2352_04245 [Caulobacterales bacterium RIFOXYB1_FULL_67_16]|nr:MAG: hypothetical protein A2352_04245 [Caulobacterales bacterium RIFOXYB1_FULL_67_16]